MGAADGALAQFIPRRALCAVCGRGGHSCQGSDGADEEGTGRGAKHRLISRYACGFVTKTKPSGATVTLCILLRTSRSRWSASQRCWKANPQYSMMRGCTGRRPTFPPTLVETSLPPAMETL